MNTLYAATAVLVAGLALTACDNMRHQSNPRTYGQSPVFTDRAAARPIPAFTVPRGPAGAPPLRSAFYTGYDGGVLVLQAPIPVTAALLARGRERFTIYCAPCHGAEGDGRGIVVRRGFPNPPSFHEPRLRDAPAGHFFAVVTQGYGAMYTYADRVPPSDRWAIIAYIRALQRSQHATLADVPAEQRAELEASR